MTHKKSLSVAEASDAEKFYNIWKLYDSMKETVNVIRTGYWRSGIYPKPTEDQPQIDRGESDAEHGFGTAILADAVMRWFPEDTPTHHLHDVLYMALVHDVGEVEIGDIPDNGSRNEDAKSRAELAIFQRISEYMPSESQDSFLDVFTLFDTWDSENCDRIGVFIAFCDKFEALLQLVRYEKAGLVGKTGFYPGYEKTARELDCEKAVDTDNALDCWTFGCMKRFGQALTTINDPLYRIFLGILTAAVIDVRGTPFQWARAFYKELNIPINEICLLASKNA